MPDTHSSSWTHRLSKSALAWPKEHLPILQWQDRITPSNLRADLAAGLTNAAVVLPQGVAFAAIAGLPPQDGLFTAMVTPVGAAFFGSSMVMVSGPTTAISAVVFASLSPHFTPESGPYIFAALVLTLMVGLIQLSLGVAHLGRLAAFVSHSVMVGFTAAAAILIGVSQLRGALGIDIEQGGAVFERLWNIADASSHGIDWRTILIAGSTIAVTLAVPRIHRQLPAFLIALVAGTLVSLMIGSADLARIGALPSVLPSFSPVFPTFAQANALAESAFAIALIGLLEAVAIGRAFASRTDSPFSANQEIIGQGLSNIAGSMFQAYPGSGSFTRSGLNFEAGAKTPLSAIFASIALVLILFAIAPLVQYIPIAAMSGLIIIVAIRLVDWKEIQHIITSSRSETLILVVTFLIGIAVELELAITTGVMLSLGTFILRTMQPHFVIAAPDRELAQRTFRNAEVFKLPECPQVIVCSFHGPLYFGSSEMLEAEFRRIATERPNQKIIILNLKTVGDIDLSGVDTIVKEFERRRAIGGDLYVVARAVHFIKRLKKFGLYDAIGEDHVFPDRFVALSQVVPALEQSICETCKTRIFNECPTAKA
ncbi:MAG: SulP family inorganic anion transporter [Pseudomonadota bacterium]